MKTPCVSKSGLFVFLVATVPFMSVMQAEAGAGPGIACIPSYAATQSYQGVSIASVEAFSQVGCPRLTAPGTPNVDYPAVRVPAAGYQHQPQDSPPAQAQACGYRVVKEPVTVVTQAGGAKVAQWHLPEGGMDHANEYDMASTPPPASGLQPPQYAVAIIGQNPLFARLESNDTTYGGTNGWACRGGTWTYKDHCTDFSVPSLQACLFVGSPASVAAPPAGVPDPRPFLQNLDRLTSVKGLISAGQQGTSPSDTTRQFVNLPSCWWLNGTKDSQSFDMRIQTPPDASGRSMTYVYRIDVGLTNVLWDYGDGTSYDGDVGKPWTPEGSCSNAHTYDRVSRLGNPGALECPAGYPHPTSDDGCYLVRTTETYATTITAYWYDGLQTGGPVDMGSMAPIVISPSNPTSVRMLQIEGVPVTP